MILSTGRYAVARSGCLRMPGGRGQPLLQTTVRRSNTSSSKAAPAAVVVERADPSVAEKRLHAAPLRLAVLNMVDGSEYNEAVPEMLQQLFLECGRPVELVEFDTPTPLARTL